MEAASRKFLMGTDATHGNRMSWIDRRIEHKYVIMQMEFNAPVVQPSGVVEDMRLVILRNLSIYLQIIRYKLAQFHDTCTIMSFQPPQVRQKDIGIIDFQHVIPPRE